MNDKKTTKFIDDLIDSASTIENVNTPPFFKDKVLSKLGKHPEANEVPQFLYWFTPKVQLVALMVFIFVNLGVLYYYENSGQEQELQSFAETYGLLSSQEESILN